MTQDELRQIVLAEHPDLLLVSPHVFQLIMKHDLLQKYGIQPQLPQRTFYEIHPDQLFRYVWVEELGVERERLPKDSVTLVQLPEKPKLRSMSREAILLDMWRQIFQARVHQALWRAFHSDSFSQATIQARIEEIGRCEFAEARTVLEEESFLFPLEGTAYVYMDFVAFFLQSQKFTPELTTFYFPGLFSPTAIEKIVGQDLNVEACWGSSRLEGAAWPKDVTSSERAEAQESKPTSPIQVPETQPLPESLQKHLNKSNYLRAFLAALRADQKAEPSVSVGFIEEGLGFSVLGELGKALEGVMGDEGPRAEEWQRALYALTPQIRLGLASSAGRLLYVLQKLVREQRRELYQIDLVDWALSLGKRPMKRDLRNVREVLSCRYIRRMLATLGNIRLPREQHKALLRCLETSLAIAERRLREKFQPLFSEVFAEVGLQPSNRPESIAEQNLTAELVDLIVQQGYFSMSQLRDAIARNNLNMDDLQVSKELWAGDALLRADQLFHERAQGVYRRGEVYLRGLQRGSSLFFGTKAGRTLTLWLLLPLVASFVMLEGLQHILHVFTKKLMGAEPHLLNMTSFVALSFVFLGVFNSKAVRDVVFSLLKGLWGFTVFLLWHLPYRISRLALVLNVRKSLWYLRFNEYVLKPGVWTLVCSIPLLFLHWNLWVGLGLAVVLFVALSYFLNSALGRIIHAFVVAQPTFWWERIRHHIVPGMLRWIAEFFSVLLQRFDHLFYRVDEWMRFRSEENILSVGFKAVFGVVWFFITYFFRFYVNLFVEPQVNPIKHFPVVTVSHKIILPFTKPMTLFLAAILTPFLGAWIAGTFAAVTVVLLPGVFGFLAWELKENWRIYESNRPDELRPVLIGSHGETMVRFMRPGFHSGTLPKLYRKLRRYQQRQHKRGRLATKHTHENELHHVEEEVQRFVEREMLQLLAQDPRWTRSLQVHHVETSTNCIQVALVAADAQEPLLIRWEEREHWLLARLQGGSWLHDCSVEERQVFQVALAGLYKLSGVQLVHEEVQQGWGGTMRYDLHQDGLEVWPDATYAHSLVHSLQSLESASSQQKTSSVSTPSKGLVFSTKSVLWDDWVLFWEGQPSEKATWMDNFQHLLPSSKAGKMVVSS